MHSTVLTFLPLFYQLFYQLFKTQPYDVITVLFGNAGEQAEIQMLQALQGRCFLRVKPQSCLGNTLMRIVRLCTM